MAECGSLQSPTSKYVKPISSIFFNCPRLFTGITPDAQLLMSPTSILDSIPFSGFKNPFCSESNTPKSIEQDHRRQWTNLESDKVGLSILDSLETDNTSSQNQSKPHARMVLSNLKIHIPPQPSSDFGIKTRNSQTQNTPKEFKPLGVFSGCLSPTEMEQSEDYTRVISHGPNPKTTHIYDNCIVQSCCGYVPSLSKTGPSHHSLHENFLSNCHTCRKNLSIGEDIYMYKGERAFCSSECRYEGMLLDCENENLE